MIEKKPLLEVIQSNIVDGELPPSFSLPKYDDDPDPQRIHFADGAMDGMEIYHIGQPKITDDMRQIIANTFDVIYDSQIAVNIITEFFKEVSPIASIDDIQRYIFDNKGSLDAKKVYSFAIDCLNSTEVNIVKFGLIILEMFKEPDEKIKGIIRILGLSDEFTIFSVFNMLRWKNGNHEIFELAKRVHGWGRIHAVARLKSETQEIREWLLSEGVDNYVLSDYSALDVYKKVEINKMLKEELSDTRLNKIANILFPLILEGPTSGISDLEDSEAKELIEDFINQSDKHTPSMDIYRVICTISEEERFSEFTDKCLSFINSDGYKKFKNNQK